MANGLFFLLVTLGPPAVWSALGPVAGFVAAVASALVWARLGVRPIPGLLPGLMSLTVLLVDGGVVVGCLLTVC